MKNKPVIHRPAENLRWCERTMCSTLDNMRDIIKVHEKYLLDAGVGGTVNCHILMSLVEELQVYGSRMEAALSDQKEYQNMKEKYKKMQEEVKAHKGEDE
jgi:hypothetical protein